MEFFRSRKEQIEKDFLAQIAKKLKREGTSLSKQARIAIKEELKNAAMVGAAEERHRILEILRRNGSVMPNEICSIGVLAVLGYE